MKKLLLIVSSLVISASAFAGTIKVRCSGTDVQGRHVEVFYYTPNFKSPNVPTVSLPGLEYYANISVNNVSAVYALTSRQILTGHFIPGTGTDLGPLLNGQTFDGGKTFTCTIGHVRFASSNCQVSDLVVGP